MPSTITTRSAALAISAAMLALSAPHAQAVMQDEIQVYTDDINEPGQYGVEVHVNTTPQGIKTPGYAGEVTNHHGVRLTPEFSYGLTKTTDIGLYVPTVYASDGNFYAAGLKFRFKWLPLQPEDNNGFFAGVNLELGQVQKKFSESPRGGEVRNILGWRNANWLLSANPIFEFDASPGFSRLPGLEIATKINRKISERMWLGWEHYNDRGQYNKSLPASQQGNVEYLVIDYEGEGYDLNVGLGRGTTAVSDKWTIKAVVGYSFGK